MFCYHQKFPGIEMYFIDYSQFPAQAPTSVRILISQNSIRIYQFPHQKNSNFSPLSRFSIKAIKNNLSHLFPNKSHIERTAFGGGRTGTVAEINLCEKNLQWARCQMDLCASRFFSYASLCRKFTPTIRISRDC